MIIGNIVFGKESVSSELSLIRDGKTDKLKAYVKKYALSEEAEKLLVEYVEKMPDVVRYYLSIYHSFRTLAINLDFIRKGKAVKAMLHYMREDHFCVSSCQALCLECLKQYIADNCKEWEAIVYDFSLNCRIEQMLSKEDGLLINTYAKFVSRYRINFPDDVCIKFLDYGDDETIKQYFRINVMSKELIEYVCRKKLWKYLLFYLETYEHWSGQRYIRRYYGRSISPDELAIGCHFFDTWESFWEFMHYCIIQNNALMAGNFMKGCSGLKFLTKFRTIEYKALLNAFVLNCVCTEVDFRCFVEWNRGNKQIFQQYLDGWKIPAHFEQVLFEPENRTFLLLYSANKRFVATENEFGFLLLFKKHPREVGAYIAAHKSKFSFSAAQEAQLMEQGNELRHLLADSSLSLAAQYELRDYFINPRNRELSVHGIETLIDLSIKTPDVMEKWFEKNKTLPTDALKVRMFFCGDEDLLKRYVLDSTVFKVAEMIDFMKRHKSFADVVPEIEQMSALILKNYEEHLHSWGYSVEGKIKFWLEKIASPEEKYKICFSFNGGDRCQESVQMSLETDSLSQNSLSALIQLFWAAAKRYRLRV